VNTVFVALNNWQRGDFTPYLLRSTDRGRTFTSVRGDLPDRQPVWAVVQDHVNGNLLFAGTEFTLFFSPDGGQRWVQLRGGLPTAQVRDLDVQKRESDLALGTFGRSFFVLDDYSALRGVTPEALSQEAALFPLRHAYQYSPLGQYRAGPGNWAADNPPYGALLTYHVRDNLPAGTTLAVRITNPSGDRVRQLPVDGTAGLRRVAWNLTADPPPPPPPSAGDPAGGRGAGGGRGGGGGGGGRGGRGGGGGGPAVDPGRYFAQLVKIAGGTETPIGAVQSFEVRPLPSR
jgi:uncharacterized membrane protein YgcG